MVPIDDILQSLESKTSLGKEELRKKIKEKEESLSGLISEEGAAYLVAKEMGVNLLNNEKRTLDIKNIIVGMRNVAVAGRVFKISDIINFKKSNGNEGRVVNIFIGDKSGFTRTPLWNDQVAIVEDGIIKIGDIVQISGAFAQENIYGDVELSIGKYGKIFNVTAEATGSEIDFPTADELNKNFMQPKTNRTQIKDIDLENGRSTIEIRGTIIDVIKSNFIFNVCPKCGKKATPKMDSEKFECAEHNEVEAKPEMVVSFMIDDSTGVLRVVAFRTTAEQITTTTASELNKLSVEERHKLLSGSMVGKEYMVEGRVKQNTQFGRTEMIANKVKDINISEETEKLASLLKMQLG